MLIEDRATDGKRVTIIKQSGVVAFKETSHTVEYLLVTSRKRRRWLFPKGSIPSGMDARRAAALEAFEEAGVSGVVMRGLGSYWTKKKGMWCWVTLYLMRTTAFHPRWPESHLRRRRWMSGDAAREAIARQDIRSIFERAIRLLGSRNDP